MPPLSDLWPILLYFCILPCGVTIAGSILLFLILKFYNIELPGGFKFNRRDTKPSQSAEPTANSQQPSAVSPQPTAAGPTTTINGNVSGPVLSGQFQSEVKIEQKFIQEAPAEKPPTEAPPVSPRTGRFIDRGEIMPLLRKALRDRTTAAIVGVGGMGGVGKTELAKFLAKEFSDVLWMDVNSRSLEQVQQSLAYALGMNLPPTLDADGRATLLRAAFAQNPRTVIFDDVRQGFDLLKCLPPPESKCAVLVTSRLREPPGVRRQNIQLLDVMTEKQALELLRAEGLQTALEQDEAAGQQLAKLCGYHPLALSLAAARFAQRPTPLPQFNTALTHRLTQLAAGADPKDPTANLRANFDLSYEALTAADQRRFRALAVFAETGLAPEAATAVWGEPEAEADMALRRLLTVSLLRRPDGPAERFALHDLLREYALEKLRAAKEAEATNRALAEWLIALFDKHYTDDPSTAPHVAAELDNLKEAAHWAQTEAKDGSVLALLATKPRNWLSVVFNIHELWLTWLMSALQLGIEGRGLKANCIQSLGDVHRQLSELPQARARYEEALPIYRDIGDKLGEANVLQSQGKLLVMSGEGQTGLQVLQEALNLYANIGDKAGAANIYFFVGQVSASVGQINEAIEMVTKAVELGEQIDPNHPVTQHLRATLNALREKAS